MANNHFKKINYRIGYLIVLIFIFNQLAFCQTDSLKKNAHKKLIFSYTLGGLYAGSMTGLYQLWYADYPQSKFHTFNDNHEWLKMDKVGHVFSAYTVGKYGIQLLKGAGYTDKQAAIAGPLYGYLYQTTIEVMDGFSSEWGFSKGDVLANTLGTSLVMAQALAWKEQRIGMKFSFYPTSFAKARPNFFGTSLAQNLFKDYNGQTYWLTVNPKSFMPQSKWPDWLDLSLGYGATGMYGGSDNIFTTGNNSLTYDYSTTPRRMEFYFSPDINLEKLKTKKKWIRYSLKVLNTFKFPLPTLNYTEGIGFKLQAVKF